MHEPDRQTRRPWNRNIDRNSWINMSAMLPNNNNNNSYYYFITINDHNSTGKWYHEENC